VKRHPDNPILTRADIPPVSPRVTDVSSVFNPGAFLDDGRYMLLLRVQTRGRDTVTMMAESDDGVRFAVRPELLTIEGLDVERERIFHVYDLRVSPIGDGVYVTFAADTAGGCRPGVARLRDGRRLELVGLDRDLDVRNTVLFPDKVGGRYLRLERPNDVALESGVTSGGAIRLAESDDLVTWRALGPVLAARPRYWDELVGSGPPPVRTREGWLHVYHGVARHFAAANVYQAGVCLLDLHDPSRLVARGRNNVLEPREPWELAGQVPNVVFPSGWIVERRDDEGFAPPESPVKLYYGAADTCVGLAETTVGALLEACRVG
jgi:beta-1,4-mannooligosaccharide/beta-1,4-mannosyl-N-acetylglucosamine phosphorylase